MVPFKKTAACKSGWGSLHNRNTAFGALMQRKSVSPLQCPTSQQGSLIYSETHGQSPAFLCSCNLTVSGDEKENKENQAYTFLSLSSEVTPAISLALSWSGHTDKLLQGKDMQLSYTPIRTRRANRLGRNLSYMTNQPAPLRYPLR